MAAPIRDAFRGAVERILDSWTVLKLAVSHGFGGQDSQAKAVWMVQAVDQWFAENSNIDSYEVEDFLSEILNQEFDTVADDGSLPQIAQMICGCYKLCVDGNESQLRERLSSLPQPAVQNCVQQHVEQEVPGGDEDDDDDTPIEPEPQQSSSSTQPRQQQTDMETDEDGWQTVKKKGNR